MCRCQGLVRRFATGRGHRKVCKKKVAIGKKFQAMDNQLVEPEAEAQGPETPRETSARKRGRPPGLKEALSPLEQQEKRMKTAKEKYYSERHALACKIIELHRHRAFDDHASTVKRLYERLDARAKRVVDLQLEAEAAEAAWQYERKAEEVQRLKAHMAFLEKAASEEESREAALDDAYDVIQELNEELESKTLLIERMEADARSEKAAKAKCYLCRLRG